MYIKDGLYTAEIREGLRGVIKETKSFIHIYLINKTWKGRLSLDIKSHLKDYTIIVY